MEEGAARDRTDWEFDRDPEHTSAASETALEARTDELLSLVEASGDAVVKVDENWRIDCASGSVESLFGLDAEQLVDRPLDSLLATDAGPIGRSDDQEATQDLTLDGEDTQEIEATVTTAGGETDYVRLSVSPLDRGGAIYVLRSADDQEETARERRQYAQLVSNVGDPMYVLDADNRIERVNDAMVEYTGYEREELVGRAIGELLLSTAYDPTAGRLDELAEAEQRTSDTFETTLVTKDGESILTEAKVTVSTDRDGEYAGAVGALRDIRERKQRERDLTLLKQILTRVFRHNVRNELTIVRGHMTLIEEEAGEQVREYTDTVFERTQRLLEHSEKARLLEEVIETDRMYETDLGREVEKITRSLGEQYPGATLEVDVPEPTTVEAHPNIATAIQELVENALQHAPSEEPWVSVWLDETPEFLTLFVEDESSGLADHDLEVLRSGTESRLEHGSGVGLWLVRWIVEYSGADILAHRTDRGSLMGIRFPRRESDPETPRGDPRDAPFARVPTHVRNDLSPERVHGETIVGRTAELHQLEDSYETLERTGGHAAFVTGESGIGKSTLVEQFRDRLEQRDEPPHIAMGECQPGVTPPYHAFRQAMDDVPLRTELGNLLADVATVPEDDPETAEHRKQGLFADVADELRELAMDRPVVVVVEDLQWAGSETIELLEYLLEEVGRWALSILFVGSYSPDDVGETDPIRELIDRAETAGRNTLVELEPFDRDELRQFLEHVLGVEHVPGEFVDGVHAHTGGNPLFVNETGIHLAETLGPEPTAADLPGSFEEVSLPESVGSAVLDRLDALVDPVRSVLEIGAVAGEAFTFDVLREASDVPESNLVEYVDSLVQRRVWRRADGTIEFVHGVVREKTLETIDSERCKTLHTRVAEAIQAVHDESVEDYYGRLATHYRNAEAFEESLRYYRLAGDRAFDAYAHEEALDHYSTALELAQSLGALEEVRAVGFSLAEVSLVTGEYDQAERYVDLLRNELGEETHQRRRAELLAARIASGRGQYDRAKEAVTRGLELEGGSPEQRCRLLGIGARARRKQGGYEAARETAARQLKLADDLDLPAYRAAAMRTLGQIDRSQSHYDRARDQFRECLRIGRTIDDRHVEATSLLDLGLVAVDQGRYDEAREYYEQSLEAFRTIGDRHYEAKTLLNLGNVAVYTADHVTAREYYERSLEMNRDIGDRHGEAKALNNLGEVARRQADYDQAREYHEASLEHKRELDDRPGQASSLENLGSLATDQSDYGSASEYYERSLEINRELDNSGAVAVVRNSLGVIAQRQGRYEEARTQFETALEITRESGQRRAETITLRNLGRLALKQGDPNRARQYFEEGLEQARELSASREELNCLCGLGVAARLDDDLERATRRLDAALERRETVAEQLQIGRVHLERARLALDRGNLESAREQADRAQELFQAVGSPHWQAHTRRIQGRIDAEAGRPDAARKHWCDSLGTFEEVGAPQDALDTLQRLIDTRDGHDDAELARWHRRARELVDDAPDPVAAAYEPWVDRLEASGSD